MKALELLAEKIRHGRAAGILPQEWETLVQAAILETTDHWETESAFRLRTGTGERWCQRNFARCEAVGLARRAGKKREWHIHARMPLMKGGKVAQHIKASRSA